MCIFVILKQFLLLHRAKLRFLSNTIALFPFEQPCLFSVRDMLLARYWVAP